MRNVWTVILAAGASRRFGSAKALAPWQDGTLLSTAIDKAQLVSHDRVIVVLGGYAETIRPHVSVENVFNAKWEQGMGTSIATGVQAVNDRDEAAEQILILPVDQPLATIEHLRKLIDKVDSSRSALTSQNSLTGPPIAITRAHFPRALLLDSNKGMKSVLAESDYICVECVNSLRDVDTVEDLKNLSYSNKSEAYFVAASATQLSLIEIVLGSFVHAFKIPFGGHILSLNQGLFLCHATHNFSEDRRRYLSPLHISSVSAVMKSLSPAGQKLGPMISIAMQGYLYSLSIFIFGPSRAGQSIGMMALSLWAFLQPIITLWIFYGRDLQEAGRFYYEKMQQTVPALADIFILILSIIILAKILLAAALPWLLATFGYRKFETMTSQISQKASQYAPKQSRRATSQWQAVKAAFRDLLRPGFLVPSLLVTAFLIFSETNNAQWVWKALRPIAIATVLFYISHAPWMHKLVAWLRSNNWLPRFFAVFDLTLKNLNSFRKKEFNYENDRKR